MLDVLKVVTCVPSVRQAGSSACLLTADVACWGRDSRHSSAPKQKPCFVYDWLGQWAPAGRFDNSSEKGRSKTTLLRTPKGPPVNHNCSRQGRQTHRNNVVLSFLSRRGRGRSRHTWDDTKAAHLLIYECTSTSAKYLGYGASTGRRSIRHSGMSFRSSHGRVVRCSCRPSQANKRWSSES